MPRLDPQTRRSVEATIATIKRHKYLIAGVVKAFYEVPPEDRQEVLSAILLAIDKLGLTPDGTQTPGTCKVCGQPFGGMAHAYCAARTERSEG